MNTSPLLPGQPAFVFISYADVDRNIVEQLRTDLRTQGIITYTSRESLQEPGSFEWEEAVKNAIRTSYAVLYIASPEARSYGFIRSELQIADTIYKRPIYPIWVSGAQWIEATLFEWGSAQYIDARGENYKEAPRRIREVLSKPLPISDANYSPPLAEPRNPYKGIASFTIEDTRDFFGRKQFIEELIQALKEALESRNVSPRGRFLAVVGASGSGKSSVVKAGLLARLKNGGLAELPGSDDWVYLPPILPGRHPLDSLLAVLEKQFPEKNYTQILTDLNNEAMNALHLYALDMAKNDQRKVILFVDQFEEVFSPSVSEPERLRFIELLVHATTEPHGPLVVLLTLRADFYDHPLAYPELSNLIQAHQCTLLPMRAIHDLREVIEGPAALPDVQLAFDTDLVGDLLFESKDEVGALPLLEFTLQQLFLRREGHQMTRQAYQELGGVTKILSRQAEQVYQRLPSEAHRQAARQMFLRLVELDEPLAQSTRRHAPITEFDREDRAYTAILTETRTAFVDERLLSLTPAIPQPTLEISHEILLHKWGRLTDWIQEAQQDLPLQEKLSRDVEIWERADHPKDQLYRGSQLREVQARSRRFLPNEREAAFLRASHTRQLYTRLNLSTLLLLFLLIAGLIVQLLIQHQPETLFVNSLPTVVTTLADDGPGSLRQVVLTAPAGSTITFAPQLIGTILLTSSDLGISKNLTIRGPGADTLSIDSKKGDGGFQLVVHIGGNLTLIGMHLGNVLGNNGTLTLMQSNVCNIYNNSVATLIFNHSTVSDCGMRDSSAIDNTGGHLLVMNSSIVHNTSFYIAAGIYNERGGVATLINSTVSDNIAEASAGGGAGGIYNDGVLTITNSSIFNNKTTGTKNDSGGGGIYNAEDGTMTLTNSTIAGNSATKSGGGIYFARGKTMNTITFCTIYGNMAQQGGGIFLTSPSHVTISNSVIAGNTAVSNIGADIQGTITSGGYNLLQRLSDTSFAPPLANHLTDLVIGSANSGIDRVLKDHGGPTQTLALQTSSPAIDAIPLNRCHSSDISTDQREVKRPDGNEQNCDIGAYEYTD